LPSLLTAYAVVIACRETPSKSPVESTSPFLVANFVFLSFAPVGTHFWIEKRNAVLRRKRGIGNDQREVLSLCLLKADSQRKLVRK
jgi:hypothetical protein